MASTINKPRVKSMRTESVPASRVLLMSQNAADLATCAELLRLPGSRVQMCSNYIELMLYLEHEAFQLVIMFEGDKAPPEWQGVVKQAAEASGGTPVLVFKRSEEFTKLREALAS